MKTLTLFSAILAMALAAPTNPLLPSNLLTPRTLKKCPANTAQPSGKLPKGAISTSALVPISAKQPNKAFSNSAWAKITPGDYCTIFNLELDPAATQGKVCNLVFDFPSWLQAPGLFTFLGSGKFTFTGYAIGAGAQPGVTTYNNQPAPGPSPPNPPPVMKPGNSYVINSAPCGIPAGTPGPITVSGSLCSKDTLFLFKQSNSFCPLGFFVVLTDDPGAAH
ncbi:hypothetical protein K458DRAFT_421596 [Lentithecium fluviatile CBS 122367]|uniref:Ubiquitin 3 binding protein But2 C-terminal domain-containing protein n=1 Tax=Lentithecium fluviatile CBS 122367 TaxID=1168545 RepID=A0A6G1IQW6_9PLEO|nr:hypothetical protein K458DRAFT_421596 [Lentithecium fluviatile CBS 122367]